MQESQPPHRSDVSPGETALPAVKKGWAPPRVITSSVARAETAVSDTLNDGTPSFAPS